MKRGRGRHAHRLRATVAVLALLYVTRGIAAAAPLASEEAAKLAPRVVILANSDDSDSLRIARHYAEVRQVPAANVIALPMPGDETITWRQFTSAIWNPLLARLVADHWIEAIAMDLTDAAGRRKYAATNHRIAALVVCRGVPLRINHDPTLYAEVLPFTTRAEYRTNGGAVDGELSLLALPTYPINACLPNPLFQNDHPNAYERMQVVKVSRLDGPSADDANGLVDRAVAAERAGLAGRAYVDISDRDRVGNEWLESTARQIADLGYDLEVDREPATLPETARFDAPVLYFGWYVGDLNGPFALPEFRFPPGAIALHIHSFSAATLRSTTTGWTGPLVARGVTATVGNVFEPYLQFTHRPNLMLRALARGANLVDAAYYALQALSWQEVLIGDPLYRPFAVPVDQQLAHADRLPGALVGYAVLRRAHQLDALNRKDEALALLRRELEQRPNLAVGLAIATRMREAGDEAGAVKALERSMGESPLQPSDWAVARTVAHQLSAAKRADKAIFLWQRLLADQRIPPSLRQPWLREAATDAESAGNLKQAAHWRLELDALSPTLVP